MALRNRARVCGGVLGVGERRRVVDGLGEAHSFSGPHIALIRPVRLIVWVRLTIGRPAGIAVLGVGPPRLIGIDGLALAIPARS